MARNAVCTWDFTLTENRIGLDKDVLIRLLKPICKKWCFQLEKGEKTGYGHFQGRVSLKEKSRKGPEIFRGIHWTPTSNENKDNNFYVMKEDTRVAGPWKDDDEEIYIPRQYRDKTLRPWQKQVIDSANVFDDRIINLIYDDEGCKGKSTIASIAELLYGGIDCPPINDCKELMQLLCDECKDSNNRNPRIIFIDMPRAMDKDRLYGIYSAIEQIKKGKLYDTRYKYKKWWIDSPQIWVFSNHLPDLSLLSRDRWKIWTIKDDNTLDRFLGEAKASVTLPRKRIL